MKIEIIFGLLLPILSVINAFKNTVNINQPPLLWECNGKRFLNVSLTAYYPDYTVNRWVQRGYLDSRGKLLRTLQDYLDKRVDYVTLAMDEKLKIPYGTTVCIPELNRHYRRRIRFQVRDDGSELFRRGYTRADVCVRTETNSYEKAVNRVVTLVF